MIFNWYDNGIASPYSSELSELRPQVQRSQKSQDGGDDQSKNLHAPLRKKPQEALEAYTSVGGASQPIEPALISQQIMSQPVHTLRHDVSYEKAYLFLKERSIKHAPILNKDNRLAGILSDTNLLKATSALTPDGKQMNFLKKQVGDIMITPVLTAKPGTDIRLVARILFHENMGAILIMDDDEKLAGILTRNDILRTVMNHPNLKLWI